MSTREMFIDKSSWTITKFGDVAIQQKVNVNREDTTLTKYVKGEHMSSEDIHLRSWGELQDEYLGPAFIRYFEEGDILYGSRRTYLKKVSIAPFEGITSNTTFVIKANEEKIDKRILPFLMLSDGFTEHSIMHSKGSVNPYINWKDLAKYEFLLPPKDQQAELAELLWAMDELIEREKEVLKLNKELKKSTSKDLLLGLDSKFQLGQKSPYGLIPNEWSLIKLFDLRDKDDRYSFTGGPFGSDLKSAHYTDNGVRVLQLQNIGEGEFLGDYEIFTSEEKADQLKSCNIFPGEIILAKMAPVARCCIIPDDDARYVMCSDGIRLKVDSDRFDNKFIYHALNSNHFRRFAETKSTGTTRGRIGLSDLKEIPIPIPGSVKEQMEIASKLNSIDEISSNCINKRKSSQVLQKSLINQIF